MFVTFLYKKHVPLNHLPHLQTGRWLYESTNMSQICQIRCHQYVTNMSPICQIWHIRLQTFRIFYVKIQFVLQSRLEWRYVANTVCCRPILIARFQSGSCSSLQFVEQFSLNIEQFTADLSAHMLKLYGQVTSKWSDLSAHMLKLCGQVTSKWSDWCF